MLRFKETAATSIPRLRKPRDEAKVLVLTDVSRAAAFRAHAPRAVVLTNAAPLEGLGAQFDAAVVDGLLEHERWDRWMLQRVHRVLCLEAPIVVVVPRLVSIQSATDVRFLAYASRRVLLRLLQRWRLRFELPGPVHRRYRMQRLARTMESLGYTAIEVGRSTLMARKAASLSGTQGRGWPAPHAHSQRYAGQHASLAAPRDAWLSIFPQYRVQTPRALEVSAWRDARVLVLSPHPDDELVGCGGTICRVASAGARIFILQATDGCKLESLRDLPEPRRKTIRLEESARVAAALGAGLVLWREEDAELRCSSARIAQLARLLAELRPTHVFTPFLGDTHGDHRTLSRILGRALSLVRQEPQVLQYEVWSLAPANLYCDVTDQAEIVESLLLLYERAMQVQDFVHFCENRNLARALELTAQPAYVEAFLSTTSAEYRRLVEGAG